MSKHSCLCKKSGTFVGRLPVQFVIFDPDEALAKHRPRQMPPASLALRLSHLGVFEDLGKSNVNCRLNCHFGEN